MGGMAYMPAGEPLVERAEPPRSTLVRIGHDALLERGPLEPRLRARSSQAHDRVSLHRSRQLRVTVLGQPAGAGMTVSELPQWLVGR